MRWLFLPSLANQIIYLQRVACQTTGLFGGCKTCFLEDPVFLGGCGCELVSSSCSHGSSRCPDCRSFALCCCAQLIFNHWDGRESFKSGPVRAFGFSICTFGTLVMTEVIF
jgi:hypothetical protein